MSDQDEREYQVTAIVFISATSKEEAESTIHNAISKIDGLHNLEIQDVEAEELPN